MAPWRGCRPEYSAWGRKPTKKPRSAKALRALYIVLGSHTQFTVSSIQYHLNYNLPAWQQRGLFRLLCETESGLL
jgi:hypothetical protein